MNQLVLFPYTFSSSARQAAASLGQGSQLGFPKPAGIWAPIFPAQDFLSNISKWGITRNQSTQLWKGQRRAPAKPSQQGEAQSRGQIRILPSQHCPVTPSKAEESPGSRDVPAQSLWPVAAGCLSGARWPRFPLRLLLLCFHGYLFQPKQQ